VVVVVVMVADVAWMHVRRRERRYMGFIYGVQR